MRHLLLGTLLFAASVASAYLPIAQTLENNSFSVEKQVVNINFDYAQLVNDFRKSVPLRPYELAGWYRGSGICYDVAADKTCIQPELALHSTADGTLKALPRIVMSGGKIGEFKELNLAEFNSLASNYQSKVAKFIISEVSLQKDALTSSLFLDGELFYYHARKTIDGRILVAAADLKGDIIFMMEFLEAIYPAAAIPAVPKAQFLGGFHYSGGFLAGEFSTTPKLVRQVSVDLSQCAPGVSVVAVEAYDGTNTHVMERYSSSLPYYILPGDAAVAATAFRVTVNGSASNCGVLAYGF